MLTGLIGKLGFSSPCGTTSLKLDWERLKAVRVKRLKHLLVFVQMLDKARSPGLEQKGSGYAFVPQTWCGGGWDLEGKSSVLFSLVLYFYVIFIQSETQ